MPKYAVFSAPKKSCIYIAFWGFDPPELNRLLFAFPKVMLRFSTLLSTIIYVFVDNLWIVVDNPRDNLIFLCNTYNK